MREWLRNLFAPRPYPSCSACDVLAKEVVFVKMIYEQTLQDLRKELEFHKSETLKFQEALFRVARISPPIKSFGEGEVAKAEAPREFSGSHRNWKDVRSSLERAHRKVEADSIAAYWAHVNAKAEQEIPELKDALEGAKSPELAKDVEELSK